MRLPFFFPPSTRLPYGFRSFAGACCICVALASGSASAQLSPQDVEDAIFNAMSDWALSDPASLMTYPRDVTGRNLSRYLYSQGPSSSPVVPYSVGWWMPILNQSILGVSSNRVDMAFTNSLPDIVQYLEYLYGSQDATYQEIFNIESGITGLGFTLEDILFQVDSMDFRSDVHGSELLVAAPDLETLLEGSFRSLFEYQQSLLDNVGSVNVANWPDYFTGEYDSSIASEMQSYSYFEADWESQVDESGDLAYETEDDASEDSPYFADVTNAVGSVSLSTDDQDENLPIRDEVFNPISDDLIPASVVNRNFSSDVLILPAVPQFHIPELSWDGNDSAWQGFLSRSGSLMSSLYDVFFALFVVWLIWREYNFYFRTM